MDLQSGSQLHIYLNAATQDRAPLRMDGGAVSLGGASGNATRIQVSLADDVFGVVDAQNSVVLRIADGADDVLVDGFAPDRYTRAVLNGYTGGNALM